jgi:hypothetical protein
MTTANKIGYTNAPRVNAYGLKWTTESQAKNLLGDESGLFLDADGYDLKYWSVEHNSLQNISASAISSGFVDKPFRLYWSAVNNAQLNYTTDVMLGSFPIINRATRRLVSVPNPNPALGYPNNIEAKGSIMVGSGTDTEILTAGTNGHVLTLDSTQPLGVKWASPVGGGVGEINEIQNQTFMYSGAVHPANSIISNDYTWNNITAGAGWYYARGVISTLGSNQHSLRVLVRKRNVSGTLQVFGGSYIKLTRISNGANYQTAKVSGQLIPTGFNSEFYSIFDDNIQLPQGATYIIEICILGQATDNAGLIVALHSRDMNSVNLQAQYSLHTKFNGR